MMKTVDEVISTWSPEEREKLKDLIEECRERERGLAENTKQCQTHLAELSWCLVSLVSGSKKMKEQAEELSHDLFGIYLRSYKKKMPLC